MPILDVPMSPVIATRYMTRTLADGSTRQATVEIGQPLPCPPNTYDGFYCTVRMTGVQYDELLVIDGVDEVHAISMALHMAGQMLGSTVAAQQLDFGQLANYGFPVIINELVNPNG